MILPNFFSFPTSPPCLRGGVRGGVLSFPTSPPCLRRAAPFGYAFGTSESFGQAESLSGQAESLSEQANANANANDERSRLARETLQRALSDRAGVPPVEATAEEGLGVGFFRFLLPLPACGEGLEVGFLRFLLPLPACGEGLGVGFLRPPNGT
ncbi:hypothetical protein SAMD00079811_01200 [Scytonema sp. HK-05]|nr:hypothetical protein NIES2130_25100 [Scytonema sp. HK-05]BAY42542.1 hypothetical protein SAMD00079811_01200 [Scytonema sp. HK-05]